MGLFKKPDGGLRPVPIILAIGGGYYVVSGLLKSGTAFNRSRAGVIDAETKQEVYTDEDAAAAAAKYENKSRRACEKYADRRVAEELDAMWELRKLIVTKRTLAEIYDKHYKSCLKQTTLTA